MGLDLLPRRPAAGLPARHLRAAGLRLRRQDARRAAGPRGLERRRFADALEKQAADLKRRFNRDFWIDDGEYFALALDGDGGQVDALASNIGHLLWSGIVDKSKAKAVVAPPDGPAAVLGLGYAHDGGGRGPVQPDRLPRRHRVAVRQLVHRLGPAALRLQGRGGAASRPGSWMPPSSSTAVCPRRSAATTGRDEVPRRSTRRPAARRPGRPGRRFCCCARCSASSRSAITSSSIRYFRSGSDTSSCSISPAGGDGSTRSAGGASASGRRRVSGRR